MPSSRRLITLLVAAVLSVLATLLPVAHAQSLSFSTPIATIPTYATDTFTVAVTYSSTLAASGTINIDILNPANSYSWHGKGTATVNAYASGTVTITITVSSSLTANTQYLLSGYLVLSSTYNANPGTAYQSAVATATRTVRAVLTGNFASGLALRRSLGSYSYSDALSKSLLFYEAQRSGYLPSNNRISWRGNSATSDGSDNGVDLTGGYYDAGDHVKFNLPGAYTVTMLAWGFLNWQSGYSSAGQTSNLRAAIKWETDYLIKCHVSNNVLYGQVGDPSADHATWDRIERWTSTRPSYRIDTSRPGSDLAGATAAALASAYLVFRDVDSSYAATLLSHARTLFTFANTYRGFYTNGIPSASSFYGSSFYFDELAWAAAWLYRATGESSYLSTAQSLYSSNGLANRGSLYWGDVSLGVTALLLQLTGSSTYQSALESYLNSILAGGTTPYTTQGQVFLDSWGSLRFSMNAAFIALTYADWVRSRNTWWSNRAKSFAFNQLHYALGDSGFSFVIGVGSNYPRRPHHRGASCPVSGTCGWAYYNSNPIAPNILNGALVGGPSNVNAAYTDVITSVQTNEAAIDYNAAYTGVLARANMGA